MKHTTIEPDDLKPEYDLGKLRVKQLGIGRKGFGDVVKLDADVAQAFLSAEAVNEALRTTYG